MVLRRKVYQADIDLMSIVDRVVAKPTIHKVGLNDVAFRAKIDGLHIWQYRLWHNMLTRCFSPVEKARHQNYSGTTCCDEWLSFANFLEWVNMEVDYKGNPCGMQLDKDILIKGNTIYSPNSCCFVPKAVNSLLTLRDADRGEWPLGVHFNKKAGRFMSAVSCFGSGQKSLGCYDTPEDAFAAYKIAKEAQIKLVALQHKAALKTAVFESLMNWEITP